MIRSLNGDDVGAEVRSEKKAQGLDGVRLLWLTSGEAELSELFVWLQHHHVWSEHNPRLLLFVVVDLDSCVVRHTEGDHTSLVTLGSRGSAPRAT